MALTDPRPKRLAVTISGAVSLGSYEAGVLYELTTAIAAHNQTATPADSPTGTGYQIKIDVLTGASAGGMTAAIAAGKLLFDAASFRGPYDNPFFFPWVKGISIQRLLAMTPDENPALSLFSSDAIESLAGQFITAPGAATPLPHGAVGSTVKLGLAMSNLNGVVFGQPTLAGAPFCYRRFQDELKRTLSLQSPGAIDWDELRSAAVSCGAFPFAFRVKEVARQLTEYPGALGLAADPAGTPLNFAYTDGGVFQNEPLGIAKDLVDEIDRPEDTDSRFYLYVSPWVKETPKAVPFTAKAANFLRTGSQLLGAVFQQARFQDWITAERVNGDITRLNQRAGQLGRALLDGKIDPAVLTPAIHPLRALLLPDPEDVRLVRDRLRKQFKTLDGLDFYAALNAKYGAAAADLWIDLIAVLEEAADLSDRDEMRIYTITAGEKELAGDLFEAFGGFFDEQLRLHDYNLGRLKTQQWLATHAGQPGANEIGIGPIHYTPADIPTIDPRLGSAQMGDLDLEARRAVKARLLERMGAVLKQEIPAWYLAPVRWLSLHIAGKKIDTFLAL